VHFFKAFGLTIQSDFPFQGFEIPEKGIFDVHISKGHVPKKLEHRQYKGVNFECNSNDFLLQVDDVAHFLISNGKSLTIDPNPSAKLSEIELFTLGSAMATLLVQRNIIPFHGAAFEKDGKAIVIGGNSGVGKSSLLQYFALKGYQCLTDDVCALSIVGGKVVLSPSYPSAKLWDDTILQYQINVNPNQRLRPDIEKFKVPFQSKSEHNFIEIDSVHILHSHNGNQFEYKEVKGFDKFKLLKSYLYRPKFIDALEKESILFQTLQLLAQQCPIFEIKRSNKSVLFHKFNEYANQCILNNGNR